MTAPSSRSLVPRSLSDSVRVASFTERAHIGHALAQCFAEEELSFFLLDGDKNELGHYSDEQRWDVHHNIMRYVTALYIAGGTVTISGPDFDTVALWTTPGQNLDTWWHYLRSGYWKLNFLLPAKAKKRLLVDFFPMLHDIMKEVLGERANQCYYLSYIGTKRNSRKKGYASRTIKHMTDQADKSQKPMYLESSSVENDAYYAKLGFELKKVLTLNHAGPPITLQIMVREPQPLKESGSFPSVCHAEVAEGRDARHEE